MNHPESFTEISYRLHEDHFRQLTEEDQALENTWFETDTVDYWRIKRVYDRIAPFIQHHASTKWVTIGDGRFGLDAVRLKGIEPSLYVLPTDISEYLLEKGKQRGVITEYKLENAEKLSFADGSFDFAFCKDAYHHFPRPYIAVYEMLRVARKAVLFIEPNDKQPFPFPGSLILKAKRFVKRLLGRVIPHSDTWNFEDSGNYIYSMSVREAQKLALGLQLPAIAYAFHNDYYEYGVEFVKQQPDTPIFRKVRQRIRQEDRRVRWGLQRANEITLILFKERPDPAAVKLLESTGFNVEFLPVNPYLEQKLAKMRG